MPPFAVLLTGGVDEETGGNLGLLGCTARSTFGNKPSDELATLTDLGTPKLAAKAN